jgi:hypothetical protein
MHVLFAAQSWAHPGHDQQSANQVTYEFARVFREAHGCRVSFVCTYWQDRTPPSQTEALARASLENIGIEVLDPIRLPTRKPVVARLATLIGSRPELFFPEIEYRPLANQLVERLRPDAVVVVWSEMTTQLFAEADTLRVAYYGNPDPKNWRINALPPVAPSRGVVRDALTRIRLAHLERHHLREMRRYDLFAEVAANDVEYYRRNGVSAAFYERMVYIDRHNGRWEGERNALESEAHPIIVANLGSQSATGNMLALTYLGQHVLDPLRSAFAGKQYQLHLYGGGRLASNVARMLDRPEVKNFGYVEDIDNALLSAPVFLCLNNATAYKVNQSRYLHVWSLGGCIVAHSDARLSLPEMVHNENALLGNGPEEIALLVARAATDRGLRRRIGRNGYETFRTLFNASNVGGDLVKRMREMLRPV